MPRLLAVTTLGMVLAAALAACVSSPAPATVAAPSARPVPIDGVYSGLTQLSRGDAINCGNANPISLHVKDQAFTYRLDQPRADWKPFIIFTGAIAPDGSFNARSGPDSMSGRIVAGTMQGVIVGDICGFSFVADRGAPL